LRIKEQETRLTLQKHDDDDDDDENNERYVKWKLTFGYEERRIFYTKKEIHFF